MLSLDALVDAVPGLTSPIQYVAPGGGAPRCGVGVALESRLVLRKVYH